MWGGPRRVESRAPGFEAGFRRLLAAQRDTEEDVQAVVAGILADVRSRGDAAVLDYTRRFDRHPITVETLRITAEEIEEAAAACSAETIEALGLAAERIAAFHLRQMPAGTDYVDEAGVRLGAVWRPVAAAGLCGAGRAPGY